MAATAGIISAVVGVVGAVTQARAARKAGKQQEKAARVANKQASLQRQRDIRQRVAAARVRQAEITAAGFVSGAPGSSVVAGARGGLQSDTGAAIGFSNQIFGLEQQRISALNSAQQAQNQGQIFGSVAGGIQNIAGLFS